MTVYLEATTLLDYNNNQIQELIKLRNWKTKEPYEQILEIYNFVRDEIKFGYNIDDAIKASSILNDGYGQCNTKGILFMALLRAVGIPCRIHGFTIDKALQKGAMTGIVYNLAPKNIVHSWVEVYFEGKWYNMEGFILDMAYLRSLQAKFSDCSGSFCGYGAATKDFMNPEVNWNKNDTYIQKEGINQDFGVFNSPDEFFSKHNQNLTPLKKWFFRHFGRKFMNQNVSKIRGK